MIKVLQVQRTTTKEMQKYLGDTGAWVERQLCNQLGQYLYEHRHELPIKITHTEDIDGNTVSILSIHLGGGKDND